MYIGLDKKKNYLSYLVGILITILCLSFIYNRVEISKILVAFSLFHWPYLIFGILSLSIGYAFRILRWSIMLSAVGNSVTWLNCSAPFLGSIAINNIMPFRLGDVVRAFVFPSAMGISKTISTGSLLLERFIDLVVVLTCLALSLFFLEIQGLPLMVSGSLITLIVIGNISFVSILIFSKNLSRYLEKTINKSNFKENTGFTHKLILIFINLLKVFKTMSKLKEFIPIVVTSLFVWLGEAGLFFFVLLGFGLSESPIAALLVMAIATLSTLVPSSPGYIGPFHLAAFSALVILGENPEIAGSFAVLAHLSIWLPTTLAGAFAICIRPSLFSRKTF